MPLITTSSDFLTGETKIPNVISGNVGEGLSGDFQAIQLKAEKELLLNALGKVQYLEFQTALGEIDNVSNAKWKLIKDSEWFKPMVILYVYCKWLRFDEIIFTTTGTGKPAVKNQTRTDYNQKYVERWNEFVGLNIVFYDYLLDNDFNIIDFKYYEFENQFGL